MYPNYPTNNNPGYPNQQPPSAGYGGVIAYFIILNFIVEN